MKVEFVILADAAQVVGGKLYLLGGGWNRIGSQVFPAQVPLAVAVSIVVDAQEAGRKYPVSLELADEGGIPIVPPIKAEIAVGKPDPALAHTKLEERAMLALQANIQVPRAGRYTFKATAGTSSAEAYFDALFVGTKIELKSGSHPSGH